MSNNENIKNESEIGSSPLSRTKMNQEGRPSVAKAVADRRMKEEKGRRP